MHGVKQISDGQHEGSDPLLAVQDARQALIIARCLAVDAFVNKNMWLSAESVFGGIVMTDIQIEGLDPTHEDPARSKLRGAFGALSGVGRMRHELAFRLRDLVALLLAMPIVLPLIPVIALLIKLDDPKAPVLFFQTRFGRFGKPFRVAKFRTMVPNAEALKVELLALSEDKGAGFKLDHDPRVTRPGRILRKLYLDELPQLWNVLKGDMTLVGPRPNSFSPDTYEDWQHERLRVPPGLTGSWQVMYPKPKDFETRCHIDIAYVRNRTFFGDIAILLRTVLVCFVRRTGS